MDLRKSRPRGERRRSQPASSCNVVPTLGKEQEMRWQRITPSWSALRSDWPWFGCQGRLPAQESVCWHQRQVIGPDASRFPDHLARGNVWDSRWTGSTVLSMPFRREEWKSFSLLHRALFCLYCCSCSSPQHSSLRCNICPSFFIHSPQSPQPLSTWSQGDWRIMASHGSCEAALVPDAAHKQRAAGGPQSAGRRHPLWALRHLSQRTHFSDMCFKCLVQVTDPWGLVCMLMNNPVFLNLKQRPMMLFGRCCNGFMWDVSCLWGRHRRMLLLTLNQLLMLTCIWNISSLH